MTKTRNSPATLGLLQKIVEGQAYRQLMLANIRGAGIRFMPDLESKIALAKSLDNSLQQFRELVRLYQSLGFGDIIVAIRPKLDRVPYPGSRIELAICTFLCERVNFRALQAYVNSSCKEFAVAAQTRLDEMSAPVLPEDTVIVDYCRDPANRPHAQQLLNRWLTVTLLSLGRPGTAGDQQAVTSGLRSEHVADMVGDFIRGLDSFLEATGLAFPKADALGVELPKLAPTKRTDYAAGS